MDFAQRSPLAASNVAAASAAAGRPAPRFVATWLLVCSALLFAMVVVGGVTRLTHSGLSITEWQPIVGTLPPFDQGQWSEAFSKYQATPEYRQVNRGMTLEAFKAIFWWEYFHRLLGRAIGVAFLLPLLWFVARRRIPPGFPSALFGIFLLGGLQGALGWYMVESGLVDDPRVSHLRLTAHLGLAFVIFAAMLWTALSLLDREERPGPDAPSLRRYANALSLLVFAVALTGGLVAGTRAGFAYNTFPLMNGHAVPPEILFVDPWYMNFFNNMATVQFDHRVFALALAALVVVFWRRAGKTPGVSRRTRLGAHLLLGLVVAQIVLGICTLLLVVPVPLAATHQAGALLLFAASLNVAHALRR